MSTSSTTTGTIALEKRLSSPTAGGAARKAASRAPRASGNNAPIQNATHTACRNSAGRLTELRLCRAGVAAERKREPHAEEAEQRQAPGEARRLRQAGEEAGETARRRLQSRSGHKRSRGRFPSSALRVKPASGRSSASTPCRATDAGAAISPAVRSMSSHGSDRRRETGLGNPGTKEGAADAGEEPDDRARP